MQDRAERERRAAGHVGHVHSVANASAVDGPGFRYVVWLMGCHLRCAYCHNPDTWALPPGGDRREADDVLADVGRYARFLRQAGGGLTVSGGEPLVQHRFAMRLLSGAKALGLHAALDTNGYLGDRLSDEELGQIDLVLLDLKAFDETRHRELTGSGNRAILAFAERLARLGQPAWVRYVLVPGLTDEPTDLRALAQFVAGLRNVERVEVLPFHQLGSHKWRELGLNYALADTPTPTAGAVDATRAIFRGAGVTSVA